MVALITSYHPWPGNKVDSFYILLLDPAENNRSEMNNVKF